MQLLVQNRLDPSRATEIFFVPKRRFFALPKIVRYRNKSGLQYIESRAMDLRQDPLEAILIIFGRRASNFFV